MKGALTVTVAIVVSSAAVALPANAQWLNHPTPNIPAPPTANRISRHRRLAPRTAISICQALGRRDRASLACATRRSRQRRGFSCASAKRTTSRIDPRSTVSPAGQSRWLGWRRIIQTPSLIAIAYDTLTYRLIFMDGRKLEANPERTWMGYSVGRWEGDTLVVDSFGFNDRTWLDGRGLPHTEALPDHRTLRAAQRRTVAGRAHRDRSRRVRQGRGR
jgi:hypothetical protein